MVNGKVFKEEDNPLPLKKSQRGYPIINRFTHNRYYEWVKYSYDKDYHGLLFSTFRKKYLGWCKKVYHIPILPEIFDDIDEAELDAREYTAVHCTILLGDTKYRKLV
jgi:hypothetical protein